MITTLGQHRRRQAARLAGTALVIVVAAQGAVAADDTGVHEFFLSGRGISAAVSAPARAAVPSEPPGQPSYGQGSGRPLTVRLHHDRARPRVVARSGGDAGNWLTTAVPTAPGKVSIYEDRTLRRGDAVMTAEGIRVFAGSTSWPYKKADFVALERSKGLARGTAEVLAGLNSLPRS